MRFLRHAWIRRKAAMNSLPMQRFRLVVAQTAEQYRDAFRLLQVGYVFEGIEPVSGRALRISEHHVLRESTVVLAYEGRQVVGTMTVTLDSPGGLPLERDYQAEIAALRGQPCTRLAELGSFAIVRRCWNSGVAQLLGIACVQLGVRQRTNQFVIGVHPKAGEVYSALYGFTQMGKVRPHCSLKAPVVGLQVDSARLEAHWRRHYRPLPDGTCLAACIFRCAPMPCFALPRDVCSRRFTRRKMPSGVFQQIFGRESDRLETLSDPVRTHLERTDARRLIA